MMSGDKEEAAKYWAEKAGIKKQRMIFCNALTTNEKQP